MWSCTPFDGICRLGENDIMRHTNDDAKDSIFPDDAGVRKPWKRLLCIA
jgi:hypothetical protein